MIGPIEEHPNGVIVYQVTDEAADKCNIYCEYPWCPPDASRFVYVREAGDGDPNGAEFVACDFGNWEKRVIGRGTGGCSMANNGKFYYTRTAADGRSELVRVDLDSLVSTLIPLPAGMPVGASPCVGLGERYIAYSQVISYRPQCFGVGLADLQTGACEIIHTDPYICNQHLQFEPGEGKLLMVQHNRGCRFTPDGKMELLVGPEGCTLFLLEIPNGAVHRLQVGPPYTASLSGHETWLGNTGEVLASLNLPEDYDLGKGPVIGVRPGQPARTCCAPLQVNHIGIEPSGRTFCGDAYDPDLIVLGSPWTDRMEPVCPARASYRRGRQRPARYDSHPHAYLAPDRRWVVFNSDRDGVQQIYCARIPEEMIGRLDAPA